MYIMQLTHVKSIDEKSIDQDFLENTTEKLLKKMKIKKFRLWRLVKDQLKSMDQVKTLNKNDVVNKINFSKNLKINSFIDLINLAEKNKEIELKYDLERNVKLVKFENGKIDINFNENLNKNFIKKLSQSLLEWTGKRWIISLSKNENFKSIHQQNIDNQSENLNKEMKSETFKEVLKIFPDAILFDVGKEDE